MALPKTFTGGERLFAGDLNDNFEALDTRINTNASNLANASNLTSGTVAAERLGNVPAANITGEVAQANLALKFATGGSSGSTSASGVTITFPAGRFSERPRVATSSQSAENLRSNTLGGVTSTGFTLYTIKTDNSTYNAHPVDYIAVGV